MENYPKKLAIQSDMLELQRVEGFLRQLFENENLPENAFNKVLLCVNEAVVNSIEHGNKNIKQKQVTIEISCVSNDLFIVVTDEGEGFDYTEIADPTLIENIKKETGRGIFIMKSICNQLQFREDGKSVEIKIELV